ncbi:LysE family translocator [Flaviflagellibacter deserti]|uniref:LysE family translocator n=1 Tax=Flaviflagellibacter deserti TaxID=2267266 RepID=A0ABV9Z6I9_9HYPH
MIDISELAALLGVFALAVVAPGVDFAFIVRESTGFGRRAGVMAAWGLAASILVHVTYTVLGVGLLVSQSILAFNIIKWAGAAYLIFIGVMSLRAPTPAAPIAHADPPSNGRSLLRSFGMGFLTNLLNPKAALFFVRCSRCSFRTRRRYRFSSAMARSWR